MKQEHTSKDTSLNQIGRAVKGYNEYFGFRKGATVLDYGGGKYDKAIAYGKSQGFNLVVYDPFNRTPEYNARSIAIYKKSPDYITCSSVLNIIKEDAIVEDVVRKIRNLAKKGTVVVFKIHEGDGKGIGYRTIKGWQRNEKMMAYYPLLLKYFPNMVKYKELFIAQV